MNDIIPKTVHATRQLYFRKQREPGGGNVLQTLSEYPEPFLSEFRQPDVTQRSDRYDRAAGVISK